MTNQKTKRLQKKICKIDGIKPAVAVEIKKNIAGIAKKLAEEYKKDETIKKTGSEKIPSKNSIIEIIEELEYILFPGYFGDQDITESSLEYNIGSNIFKLFDKLSEQVSKSFRHKCASDHYRMCVDCYNQGIILAGKTLERLPEIRKTLNEDINAAF
ncbi:MAG TPA: hypothetical protein PLQ81_10305, partial [bacterium]|nr:hypothetical protein [bacterium]